MMDMGGGYETIMDPEKDAIFRKLPDSGIIVFTRLMCAIFLHIILTSEIKQGFNMMKFANNHWWLFDWWQSAYYIGFM